MLYHVRQPEFLREIALKPGEILNGWPRWILANGTKMGLGMPLHDEAHSAFALGMPGEVWRKMEPHGTMVITALQPIMLFEKYYAIESHLLLEVIEGIYETV